MKTCPSCRQSDTDTCSYRGVVKPGCLHEKRRRDQFNAQLKGAIVKELREQMRAHWQEIDGEEALMRALRWQLHPKT